MEKEITKSNIIILALVYNYLSNGTPTLKEWDINLFKFYIEDLIYKNQQKRISDEEEKEHDAYYYDAEKYQYGLNDDFQLYDLNWQYINDIPQEIILASLQEEALQAINVKRENLKTKKRTEHVSETQGISSLAEKDARNIARKYLELAGYKNIEIGIAYPTHLEGDKGYNINVSYDKDITYLDMEQSVKSLLKRQSDQKNKY